MSAAVSACADTVVWETLDVCGDVPAGRRSHSAVVYPAADASGGGGGGDVGGGAGGAASAPGSARGDASLRAFSPPTSPRGAEPGDVACVAKSVRGGQSKKPLRRGPRAGCKPCVLALVARGVGPSRGR